MSNTSNVYAVNFDFSASETLGVAIGGIVVAVGVTYVTVGSSVAVGLGVDTGVQATNNIKNTAINNCFISTSQLLKILLNQHL